MTTAFLDVGYSVLWLGQQLPAFTTRGFALAPFLPTLPDNESGTNSLLTAFTTLYATELSCTAPARVTYTPASGSIFDDGRGCIASGVIQTSDTNTAADNSFAAHYIGYYDDPFSDASLQLGGCSDNASHTFLAVWKRASNYPPDFNNRSNATALFCTPRYYSQQVEATVTNGDYAVLHHTPIGPKVPLTENTFNITQFEYILGNGVLPGLFNTANLQLDSQHRLDVSAGTELNQDSQLRNMSLYLPTDNMVGFAIGSTNLEPAQYLEPKALEKAFSDAHQLLFALSIPSLIDRTVNATTLTTAREDYERYAVVLVEPITLTLQAFLTVIVVITIYLVCASRKRSSVLKSDPNSFAQIMSLSTDRQLLSAFQDLDCSSTIQVEQAITDMVFHLDSDGGNRNLRIVPQPTSFLHKGAKNLRRFSNAALSTVDFEDRDRPIELTSAIGGPFILFLTALLATIIAIHRIIDARNGK